MPMWAYHRDSTTEPANRTRQKSDRTEVYHMMLETNKIYQGNNIEIIKSFPDKSINMVMTSPPYWALRDYQTEPQIWDAQVDCVHEWQEHITKPSGGMGSISSNVGANQNDTANMRNPNIISNSCSKCNAWKGSLGLEPNFELFIKHLCDIFDEVKRVLRDDGSCWVNLGDTYSATRWSGESKGQPMNNFNDGHRDINPTKVTGLPDKCLVGIPFRFALEMINRGWILRNVIIWHKPACMPSSVTDRFTVDFEYLFFFVKNQKYFFNQQFEDFSESTKERVKYNYCGNKLDSDRVMIGYCEGDLSHILDNEGRNKRAVWSINTKPFSEAHFAVYPEELCETPIKAGCPEFVCNKCGKLKEKIVQTEGCPRDRLKGKHYNLGTNQDGRGSMNGDFFKEWKQKHPDKILGLSDCGCGAGFSAGIVLDPFFGSGTTGLVSLKQNKKFVGIELNPEYIEIADKRLKPYLEQTKLFEFEVK
jgi:DNA modification methylase